MRASHPAPCISPGSLGLFNGHYGHVHFDCLLCGTCIFINGSHVMWLDCMWSAQGIQCEELLLLDSSSPRQ
jgi:hypothetical protein